MSRFGNLEFEPESHESFQEDAVELKDERYYSTAARQAFQNGDFEAGLRLFSKVLEYNPESTEAWGGQVRMLIELREYREARLWAEKALERFPSDPELLASKAVALARLGDLEGAIAFSDASIEERGDSAYVWLARGDVLLAREEQRADYCFEKALLAGQRDWFVLWLAARIRTFYEQFSQALKLLQEAIQLNPGHFLVWLDLGQCQQNLGLIGAAHFSYKQALELNPSCRARQAMTHLAQSGLGFRIKSMVRRVFR